MFESDYEKRNRLRQTWKTLIERLSGSEFPMEMIYEALADVAIEGLIATHGMIGAAHMMRLQIDAMEEAHKRKAMDLLKGDVDP